MDYSPIKFMFEEIYSLFIFFGNRGKYFSVNTMRQNYQKYNGK